MTTTKNKNYDTEYTENWQHTFEQHKFRFEVGQRVRYTQFNGEWWDGTITSRGKHDDFERFDIVYTVDLDNGWSKWGYTNQFEEI